jgi:hypothetical protein
LFKQKYEKLLLLLLIFESTIHLVWKVVAGGNCEKEDDADGERKEMMMMGRGRR